MAHPRRKWVAVCIDQAFERRHKGAGAGQEGSRAREREVRKKFGEL